MYLNQVRDDIHAALSTLIALLDTSTFVDIIKNLISDNSQAMFQHRGLQLLQERISLERKTPVSDSETALFVGMIPGLLQVLKSSLKGDLNSTAESTSMTNSQMSLLTIDILVRNFGKKQHFAQAFETALPAICDIIVSSSSSIGSLPPSSMYAISSALLCASDFISSLGARVLPQLPALVPAILTILEFTQSSLSSRSGKISEPVLEAVKPKEKKRKNLSSASSSSSHGAEFSSPIDQTLFNLTQEAAISTLETLVVQLSQFLSPYIPRLLGALLHPSLLALAPSSDRADISFEKVVPSNLTSEAASFSDIAQLLTHTFSVLSEKISPRLLLPHIVIAYDRALQHGDQAVIRVFSFVQQVITGLSIEDVSEYYHLFFKLFTKAFDLRRIFDELSGEALCNISSIDAVESSMVSAFIQLVLRLNELQMKGLFLKLLEWFDMPVSSASSSSKSGNFVSASSLPRHLKRATIFFRIVDSLMSTLKTFFLPYFSYILDYCVFFLTVAPKVSVVSSASPSSKRAKVSEVIGSSDLMAGSAVFSEDMNFLLTKCIDFLLSALSTCFQVDSTAPPSKQLLGKEYYDRLIAPLVGQLQLAIVQRRANTAVDNLLLPSLMCFLLR